MLDTSLIGKAMPRVSRDVETGRLRFFLQAIGDTERAFAGAGSLQVPPTYLFCLEMLDEPDPLAWLKGLGVNLMHILHGTQRFEYHAPAHAGDRLAFDSRIEDIYAKKGGALQFVVKKTVVTNQVGARIATLTSTVVYRDPAMKGAA